MKSIAITKFPELDYNANEALNTLCTNVTFMGSDIRRIMITSCHPQEGKSFMSMNITRTLASMGKAVVLVDSDLRKSVLASRYGIRLPKDSLGLSHYLAREQLTVDDVLYETNIVGAYFVPSGHDVINSMQLLSNWRFPDLMKQLSAIFDYIIVDAPPVGVIVDAAMIARACDGTIFVVAEDATTKHELADAVRQINTSGTPVLGSVFNKVSTATHGGKYYNRSKYYGSSYMRYYRRKDEDLGYYRRKAEGEEAAVSENSANER